MADSLTPENAAKLAQWGVIKPETADLVASRSPQSLAEVATTPAPTESTSNDFQSKIDSLVEKKVQESALSGEAADRIRSQYRPLVTKELASEQEQQMAAQKQKEQSEASKIAAENESRKKLGLSPIIPEKLSGPVLASTEGIAVSRPEQPSVVLDSDKKATDPDIMRKVAGDQISKEFKQAYDLQQQGIIEGAAAGAKEAAAESAYLQKKMDAMSSLESERQERERVRQKQLDDAQGKLQAAQDEFSKIKIENPAHSVWQGKDTGQKVATGIALFLGSFSPDGQNSAVKFIQDGINRDINIQKENALLKGNQLEGQKSVYQSMLQKFGDERAAEAATRNFMLQEVEMGLKKNAAMYKSPQVQAQAKIAFGQLEAEKQKNALAFQQAIANSAGTRDADETMTKLMRAVPKDLQSEALKELKTKQEYDRFDSDMTKTYQELNTYGLSSKIPGVLGGEAPFYAAARAKISGAIIGKVPGIKSDSDFKNIVEPMLPSGADTAAQAEKKLQQFKGFIESARPANPILDGYKVTPKPIAFGKPVK